MTGLLRIKTLISLRRVERARALECLEQAAATLKENQNRLEAEERQVEHLTSMLRQPDLDTAPDRRAAALLAFEAARNRRKAALAAALRHVDELKRALSESTTAFEEAQERAAQAHRALCLLEDKAGDAANTESE